MYSRIRIFQQQELPIDVYPHQIAFNCLPHIDVFLDNDYTREEMKMINETRKIMENDQIMITATAVRVPVFFSHSESINVETENFISADEVKEIMARAPGVLVVDNPAENDYPLAVEAAGQDDTLVGRIRQDESIANGINMWVVAIQRAVDIPVITVGGIRSPQTINKIISRGISLVALCRPLIKEPDLVKRWQDGNLSPAACTSCNRCFKPAWQGKGIRCTQSSNENS